MTTPSAIEWQHTYDRDEIERFLAAVDAERVRLENEIAEAEAELAEVRIRTEAVAVETKALLGEVVLRAQRDLADLEREHEATVARLRATATAEARRLVAAAERAAAEMRTTAEVVGSDQQPGEPTAVVPGPDADVPAGGDQVDVG